MKIPRRNFLIYSLSAVFAGILSACERAAGKQVPVPNDIPPTNTAAPTQTIPPESTATATATQTAVPTETPTQTRTPTEAPAYNLLSPENVAIFSKTGRVSFAWDAFPGADHYLLAITTPTGVKVNFKTGSTRHERYMESLPWGGDYSWTVSAMDKDGNVLFSFSPFIFTKPQGPPAEQPTGVPERPEKGGSGSGDNSLPCCFLAGTKISMADGSYMDIEKVSVGDRVMSRDVTKQETVTASVLAVELPLRSTYFIISLEDGSEIRVTGEHPLYSCKKEVVGWGAVYPLQEQNQAGISTFQLEVGDRLFEGEWVSILSIQMVAENVQTYNLKDVGETLTFFANGVLVHNKGGATTGGETAGNGGNNI